MCRKSQLRSHWAFKGDRVMFIKEYRRRKANAAAELETDGQKSLSV